MAGIPAGFLQAGWSDLQSLAHLLSHPIESLDSMRQLYNELKNSPEAREKYSDEFMRNLESKFNSIDDLIKHGGIKESLQLGQELGGLVWDVGTLVTGVTGVAKGSTKLASLGVKLTKTELDKMAKLTVAAKPIATGGKVPGAFTAAETDKLLSQITADKTPIVAHGVKPMTPREISRDPVASKIYDDYLAQGIPESKALEFTNNLLKTGVSKPTTLTVTSGTELIKVVPTGKGVESYSPFFMTKSEYEKLIELPPHEMVNKLGLPAEQGLLGSQLGFDGYSITPKPNISTTVYQSPVAQLQQGLYVTQGGAQQTLVTNRNQWTEPVKIGNIPGNKK
jgi:hypothetical protein